MKKSSIFILLTLVALAVAAIFIYKNKGSASTIDKEASDFKFKDTANIDKIFLADKDGYSVTLVRKADGWYLNDGKYRARPDMIETLLYTIASVEVKSPVSKNAKKPTIQIMASKSTKVEIYRKGEKVKQYYVGHTTQDHLGTYMILTDLDNDRNYEDPFVTHIPGFEGFLTSRYNCNEIDWRDRTVINLRPPQIKQIKMELHEIPDSSFVLELFSMQRFGLRDLKGKPIPFQEDKVKQFIAYFQNINCEIILDKKNRLVDSLSKSAVPFITLTVSDRNGGQNVCQFYHKKSIAEKNEQYGIAYNYDPDRLFIKYDNGNEYAIAQFFVFGKILQTYGYFMPKK